MPSLSGASPHCFYVGDTGNTPVWRYRAACNMNVLQPVLCCDKVDGVLMAEVYHNGNYVAEIPMTAPGTQINVPVSLNRFDSVEIRFAPRGGSATATNVWILFCANIIS